MSKKSGEKYTVRFDLTDKDSFYKKELVMPSAAVWNMDEVLMAYIAAGIDGLLKGYTDWNYWDDSWGKNTRGNTRKKLKRARKLARRYVDAHTEMKETEETIEGANECLRILIEVGITRLWD